MTSIYIPDTSQNVDVRTGNITITSADHMKIIRVSNSGSDFSITFDASVTGYNGFSCTIINDEGLTGGWGHILNVCDGVSLSSLNGFNHSIAMLPFEHRQFYVKSGSLYSVVKNAFAIELTISYSMKWPSGYKSISEYSKLWGGGASGAKLNGSTGSCAGSGGGACVQLGGLKMPAAGTIVSWTIGAQAAGKTTQSDGGQGNNSSFSWSGGVTVTAYGGGGGTQSTTQGNAGSGGGSLSAGLAGTSSGSAGGSPGSGSSTTPDGQGFGGGYGWSGGSTRAGSNAAWGGGAGASSTLAGGGAAGGSTSWGGPGSGNVGGTGGAGSGGTCTMTGATAGAGSNTGNGGDGSGYGAAGGPTRTGTISGAGAGGAILLSGSI